MAERDREELKQQGKSNRGEETEPEDQKEKMEGKGVDQQWQQQQRGQELSQQLVAEEPQLQSAQPPPLTSPPQQ